MYFQPSKMAITRLYNIQPKLSGIRLLHRAFSTGRIDRIKPISFFNRYPLGFVIVSQQNAYVIERLGKFHEILSPGIHFLIPFIDKVAYIHSLKEEVISIPSQSAITRDNVTLHIDGVLYVKVSDAFKAAYGVDDPLYAATQLAQTVMRSELGKRSLDSTFVERDELNATIVKAINEAAEPWGILCLRYEIRDILLPNTIKNAMERQAEAERQKRADILKSEGDRESAINLANGKKMSTILLAQGQAEAVKLRADAAATSVSRIAETTQLPGGAEALSVQLAENYISAFGKFADNSNTLIIPANTADAAGFLTQSLSVFKNVNSALSQANPTSSCKTG